MSTVAEVEILLATYNGERFLKDQIDSILAQDYENIRVLARDDGSSDNTVEILRGYADALPHRLAIVPSSNKTGSAKENFLRLIEASKAEYVCFCDQDDVWFPDKVSSSKRAMDKLESQWGPDLPLLVFTDLRVVNERLDTISKSFWAHSHINPGTMSRLSRLMVQSVVTGCTAMINRKMVDLALRMPKGAEMHDRWIGLLAASMGKYKAVETPTVLYRQHERNLLGAPTPGRTRPWMESVIHPNVQRKHGLQWMESQRQAKALLIAHGGELPAENREVIQAFLSCEHDRNPLKRVVLLIRNGFYYPGILPNLLTVWHLICGDRRQGETA